MEGRRMAAEGGRVVNRDKRSRKLAVVVALQNLLVAACLLITLYVYWNVQKTTYEDNVHVWFGPISDIKSNKTLQFRAIQSGYMMGLVDEKNEKIYISCTGPYVLYMDVCYKSLRRSVTTGTLQLQVVGSETPISSFTLNASDEVCKGLHSIVYLKAREEASLHFNSTDGFKIKSVTVGLSYLLGRRCDF